GVLVLFGTGYGLAPAALALADVVLTPIHGASDYNHLSVRSAAAIALDRLLSPDHGGGAGARASSSRLELTKADANARGERPHELDAADMPPERGGALITRRELQVLEELNRLLETPGEGVGALADLPEGGDGVAS